LIFIDVKFHILDARRARGVSEVDVVLDASFIKAWSIRSPGNNQKGLSDSDARVGRNGRSFGLGFKLHSSVDPRLILPLATLLASANENEKRHALTLVERTRMVLGKAEVKLRCLIADSKYSSAKVRSLVEHAVIPHMGNQRCGEDALRVDRLFRAHGSFGEVEVYRKRPAVEALFAFLKNRFRLTVNRVRGLLNVEVYSLLSVLCCVLNRCARVRPLGLRAAYLPRWRLGTGTQPPSQPYVAARPPSQASSPAPLRL
jgi:hypothetical protein